MMAARALKYQNLMAAARTIAGQSLLTTAQAAAAAVQRSAWLASLWRQAKRVSFKSMATVCLMSLVVWKVVVYLWFLRLDPTHQSIICSFGRGKKYVLLISFADPDPGGSRPFNSVPDPNVMNLAPI
jgi:ABC-type transporter Mla maintaining outer membrane lipid asymmetry permease subunit MlaE